MAKEDKRIIVSIDNVSGLEAATIVSTIVETLGREAPDAKYSIEYGEASKTTHVKTKEVK